VSFTRADADSSPRQTSTVVGLRFTVDAAHGGSAMIDFVHLRPRRLALAFASALRELAPTVVRSTLISMPTASSASSGSSRTRLRSSTGRSSSAPKHIDGFERWLEAAFVFVTVPPPRRVASSACSSS
jgi:hypothetical protein